MSLADRMKQYEAAFEFTLPTSSPTILRLDGHAFSSFTAQPHFRRPFDQRIHDAMIATCSDLLDFFPRATVAYTQSDEITLIFPDGVQLFNERVQKLSSLAASYCSVRFNLHLAASNATGGSSGGAGPLFETAHFDARFFTVPSVDEALNCLLWRCRGDAVRNSVNTFARTLFDQSQMHRKSSKELIEMMRKEKKVIYEEAVPKWAIEGCLVKRELYEHEGTNPMTGQREQAMRSRTRVEERGPRGFSDENLKLVTQRYWNDFDGGYTSQGNLYLQTNGSQRIWI
ncbi:hypothetical protein M426DRAFT_73640 [Hypoxylon sp. CI-4A]|nr:hypothetical protein M426DRAFT_73640 [Hypoxylon sp. CI-4A]